MWNLGPNLKLLGVLALNYILTKLYRDQDGLAIKGVNFNYPSQVPILERFYSGGAMLQLIVSRI